MLEHKKASARPLSECLETIDTPEGKAQQIEPYYSNFMRLLHGLARVPYFETYLLTNHFTNSWLGGDRLLPNRHTPMEREYGAQFLRNYYHQQLDWQMGVVNLWNHVPFRTNIRLEDKLPFDGIAFHAMHNMLLSETTHLFHRPIRKETPWPDLHPL